MLYKVCFKFHSDIFKNLERTLIIDMPNFIEQSTDTLEKEELIQTIIEKYTKKRIELFKYEPLTTEHIL